MRKDLLVFMLAGVFLIGIAAVAQVAEAGPENDKLKVKVGPFFIQESEKKINLEGTASQVVRKGKRINITVTVENYGKEKSEPVRLKYVETGKKAGDPRFYRIQAIEPREEMGADLMARYDESAASPSRQPSSRWRTSPWSMKRESPGPTLRTRAPST